MSFTHRHVYTCFFHFFLRVERFGSVRFGSVTLLLRYSSIVHVRRREKRDHTSPNIIIISHRKQRNEINNSNVSVPIYLDHTGHRYHQQETYTYITVTQIGRFILRIYHPLPYRTGTTWIRGHFYATTVVLRQYTKKWKIHTVTDVKHTVPYVITDTITIVPNLSHRFLV